MASLIEKWQIGKAINRKCLVMPQSKAMIESMREFYIGSQDFFFCKRLFNEYTEQEILDLDIQPWLMRILYKYSKEERKRMLDETNNFYGLNSKTARKGVAQYFKYGNYDEYFQKPKFNRKAYSTTRQDENLVEKARKKPPRGNYIPEMLDALPLAIIKQACVDFRGNYIIIQTSQDKEEVMLAEKRMKKLLQFFSSDWFEMLAGDEISAEHLLKIQVEKAYELIEEEEIDEQEDRK